MKISVILPIYNEGKIIKDTIQEILNKLPQYVQEYEIIAVDDGSSDQTPDVLSSLASKHNNICVITHRPNKGYGAALQTGVKAATHDWVFFMDSDLQFDVNDIVKLIPQTETNDLVVGYRKNRADATRRIIMSHIYNRLVQLLFSLPVRDVDCAFKLMKKSTLLALGKLSNSFFVSSEFMIKATLNDARIVELPVKHLPRTAGHSKVTPMQIVKTIRDLGIIYFSTLSLRILSVKPSFAPILSPKNVK